MSRGYQYRVYATKEKSEVRPSSCPERHIALFYSTSKNLQWLRWGVRSSPGSCLVDLWFQCIGGTADTAVFPDCTEHTGHAHSPSGAGAMKGAPGFTMWLFRALWIASRCVWMLSCFAFAFSSPLCRFLSCASRLQGLQFFHRTNWELFEDQWGKVITGETGRKGFCVWTFKHYKKVVCFLTL